MQSPLNAASSPLCSSSRPHAGRRGCTVIVGPRLRVEEELALSSAADLLTPKVNQASARHDCCWPLKQWPALAASCRSR